MFGKVVEIGSVLWSLPRMGSIFCVLLEAIPGFVKVSPQRGVKKIWDTGYFVNSPKNRFGILLKYWLVSGQTELWKSPWNGVWLLFLKRLFLKRDGRIREYICKILTISLYVWENLWTRFWIVLEGEMLLAKWIKVWVVLLIFGNKQETSIVLLCSEQVKMKKWWLDTSHAFVEIFAERRKNIIEKVWLTNQ